MQKTQNKKRTSRLLSAKREFLSSIKNPLKFEVEGIFLFLNQIKPTIKNSKKVKIKMFCPEIPLNKDKISMFNMTNAKNEMKNKADKLKIEAKKKLIKLWKITPIKSIILNKPQTFYISPNCQIYLRNHSLIYSKSPSC